MAASLEGGKRKGAAVAENKVLSLDERAKDEEKPFLEQLLQEGASKVHVDLVKPFFIIN
jgi:hypothetical protein